MEILNDICISHPAQAHLSTHQPFRTSTIDTQVNISGKIRRRDVLVLWCVLLGVSDQQPDDDILVQYALMMDKTCTFLSSPLSTKHFKLDLSQIFLFHFASVFSSLLRVEVSTELHRLMKQVRNQLRDNGIISRGILEKNESEHNTFKAVLPNTELVTS